MANAYLKRVESLKRDYINHKVNYDEVRSELGELLLSSLDKKDINLFKQLVESGLPITYKNGEPLVKALNAFGAEKLVNIISDERYEY